ncbi:MAG: hypothetical protein WCL51_08705 [Bacteroidota bacterium]
MDNPVHSFHIPVMGLAFTVESPVKVAHLGISSVISIMEDTLIEKMRGYYCQLRNEEFIPIPKTEEDYRAKRITGYLNLVNKIVKEKVEKLKESAFETGSEIVLYFEMLPNDSKIKQLYLKMLDTDDGHTKEKLQNMLRLEIRPGSIDVNIMTKVDIDAVDKDGNIIEDGSVAVSAFRGYANSDLKGSSIVLSAGMNPRLYNYIERFNQFTTPAKGQFEKKIVIKVSDYRSALIQGKFLAKKGVWVSEFRIESGLNCGGHAFATDGLLLGPILEEFKSKKTELINELFTLYAKAQEIKGKEISTEPPHLRLTVQGGIGTAEENNLLLDYYDMDGTGWGSPFLLVPEATTLDNDSLQLISASKAEDVVLSNNSPLGIRFNYLKEVTAEVEKKERIKGGKPGSPCTEQMMLFNNEFAGKPLCTASISYQRKKLEQLREENLPDAEYKKKRDAVMAKECLCLGLSNTAFIKNKMEPIKGNSLAVTICTGPNIVYFSKIATLKEMVDHIYGRTNLLNPGYRPHFFINELKLYIDYLKDIIKDAINNLDDKSRKHYTSFCNNLLNGIEYYQNLAETTAIKIQGNMKPELIEAKEEIFKIRQQF